MSYISITMILSLLIVSWTRQQRRRPRNRVPHGRVTLRDLLMQKRGAVAMLISLAIVDSRKLCLLSSFGRLCFATPNQEARRSVPLTPRLEWPDERRSFFFPPPVGAGIQAEVSRARGLRTSADILTEHPPDIFTEQ